MLRELRRLSKLQGITVLLENFSQTRTRLEEMLKKLEGDPDGSRRQLTQIQIKLQNTTLRVNHTSLEIADRISGFDKWINYWTAEKDDFQKWEKGLGSSIDLSSVRQQLQQLQSVVQEAQSELDTYLRPVLEMQQAIGELQRSLHLLDLQIDTLLESKFKLGHRRMMLFSPAFFKQFDANLWYKTIENAAPILRPDLAKIEPYKIHIAIVVIMFFILLSEIKHARPIITEQSKWRYLSKTPYSAVGFLSSMVLVFICSEAGFFWQALFQAFLLIYLWRLIHVIIEDKKKRLIIKSLIGVLLFYGTALLMNFPYTLERLVVVVGSSVLIIIIILPVD